MVHSLSMFGIGHSLLVDQYPPHIHLVACLETSTNGSKSNIARDWSGERTSSKGSHSVGSHSVLVLHVFFVDVSHGICHASGDDHRFTNISTDHGYMMAADKSWLINCWWLISGFSSGLCWCSRALLSPSKRTTSAPRVN